jgi:hypothetical protein
LKDRKGKYSACVKIFITNYVIKKNTPLFCDEWKVILKNFEQNSNIQQLFKFILSFDLLVFDSYDVKGVKIIVGGIRRLLKMVICSN